MVVPADPVGELAPGSDPVAEVPDAPSAASPMLKAWLKNLADGANAAVKVTREQHPELADQHAAAAKAMSDLRVAVKRAGRES